MPRQPSFAGGELAPELYGRNDLAKYSVGLRRMRNFFAAKQGAAVSRAGTTYLGEVKASANPVRLIPFEYSDTDSFVLEFGNQYIRVWKSGAYLGEISAGSGYANFAIPYLTAELPRIKVAQMGALVTICHPAHPPAELKWDGVTWTYAAIDFSRPAPSCDPRLEHPMRYLPGDPGDASHPYREWDWLVTEVRRDPAKGFIYESAPVKVTKRILLVPGNYDSTLTYALNDYAWERDHFYRSLSAGNTGNDPATSPGFWVKDDQLSAFGYLPMPAQSVVYPDKSRTLVLASSYANIDTDPNFIAYRIYRARDGVGGWIGDSKKATFVDVGDAPDFAQPPPDGRNPFKVYDATGALTRTEYPAAVCFFEGRRCFARSDQRPGFIWESASGDYYNFDTRLVPVADEAIEFELASRKREEIRSLVGLQKMIALTNSSAWSVGGSSGPMTFDDIDAKAEAEVGSSWVDPLVVDGAVLYPRTKGTGVRSLGFDFQRQAFAPADISLLAQHLFRGHQVVDWAFAQDPWGVVWVVRDDGLLLSLTYSKDEGVWAWAWHDTDGAVENVCAVPEGGEDAVYLVVRRTIDGATKRYIERMDSRVLTLDAGGNVDPVEAHALDCCKTYRGPATNNITGLAHLEAKQVYAVGDGQVVGALTVVGGAINLGLAGGPPTVTGANGSANPPQSNDCFPLVPQYYTNFDNQLAGKHLLVGDGWDLNVTGLLINADGTLDATVGTPEGLMISQVAGCPLDANRAFIAFPKDGNTGAVYARAYYFDWTTKTYTRTTNPPSAPANISYSATQLASGKVLVVWDPGTGPVGYIFDPAGAAGAGSWTPTTGAPNAVSDYSLRLANGKVLIGRADVFDPATGIFTQPTNIPAGGSSGYIGFSVLLHSGKALHFDNAGMVYQLDPGTLAWDAGTDTGLGHGPYVVFEYDPQKLLLLNINGAGTASFFDLGTATATPFADASKVLDGGWVGANKFLALNAEGATPANRIERIYTVAPGGGAAVAHVGLLFTPELETLDMSGDRVKQKTVVSVGFELHESKGVSVGQDFDHLDTPPAEVAFDDYTAEVPVQGTWGKPARAVLRQAQPLPVTVLGLTVEVDGGG